MNLSAFFDISVDIISVDIISVDIISVDIISVIKTSK